MRIIGGVLKGRSIKPPGNLPVRPTTDFAKEGLFNILSHRFDFSELKVLDLYAGTGNMSFEFASRGASKVVSVDESYACVQFISKTAQQFNAHQILSIKSEALSFLKNSTQVFDLVFADPPFDYGHYDSLIDQVSITQSANPDQVFILEHFEKKDFSAHPFFKEKRKYGSIVFSFFQNHTTRA